jgi:hypothetical protein
MKDICGNNADIESSLKSFGGDNDQLVLPAWRFLCGLDLKDSDLRLANVTKTSLDSSLDFAAAIGAFATIIQLETQKELLLLIDEMENLTKITNKGAEARWQESLRALLDISNLSVVCTIGAERQDGIPKIILQPDIVRRFQKDNYVMMESFKPPVAKSFVKGILNAWVDPDRRAQLELIQDFQSKRADYDATYYPFTSGGFEKFCEWAVVDQRTAKPSEIIARLNNVTAEAYLRDEFLLDKNFLSSLGVA